MCGTKYLGLHLVTEGHSVGVGVSYMYLWRSAFEDLLAEYFWSIEAALFNLSKLQWSWSLPELETG
jgi:hypothetical protein